jgi:hypothetical protein
LAALLLLTGISVRRQSPALFAIVAIGWLDSMFSHNVLIDPLFLPFAGAALGSTASLQRVLKIASPLLPNVPI